MAGGTVLARGAGMRIIAAMAALAFPRRFRLAHRNDVAAVAAELAMRASERKAGLALVIEGGNLPLVDAVAGCAIGAHPSGVRVDGLVATRAILWQLVLEPATAMTRLAAGGAVRALQRKARLLFVVELRIAPGLLRVAAGAVVAAGAAVNIIRCVAAGAGHRNLAPTIPGVAACAGQLGMTGLQREAGLAVIEANIAPEARVVTGRAVVAQLLLVRVLLAMTVGAASGSIAQGFATHVAAAANDLPMTSLQCKVRLKVVETRAGHRHDACVAAAMFAMAAAALRGRDLGAAAMKSAALGQVGRYVLVAGNAQFALRRSIAAVVAVAAIILELGMSVSQRTRHEQALERGAGGGGHRHEGDQHEPPGKSSRVAAAHPWHSVEMHGHDMDNARNQQHEEQWQMQQVP